MSAFRDEQPLAWLYHRNTCRWIFNTLESGDEVHVLRKELLLDGSGKLTLGRSARDGAIDVISFTRDRRSMYRL